MADMTAIQADRHSTQARELLPVLLRVEPADERQTRAMGYLEEWSGTASGDSVATTIYEAWLMHLGAALFEDDLRGDLYQDLASRYHVTFLINAMSRSGNTWCDNLLTTPSESCADVARVALDRALDDLTERQGKNMAKWRWQRLHRTQYPHNPFSQVGALKPLFHRQTGNGGNGYTINVAPVDYERPYMQFHVPSYRHVVDLADMGNSLFMHTTGQSGNPLSGHYDDLIERHQAVEYLPMTFGRESVSGDVLILEPR
jgi:penicillin amidase